MSREIREYFSILKGLFDKIIATDASDRRYQLDKALDLSVQMIIKHSASGGKLIFIGNGASAAISSHMAADFLKNAGIRAMAFNDSSLLTCISNDCGYKYVFEKPVKIFANNSDILFAISSSGKSENIVRGVSAARSKKVKVITLSGFNNDNPLRKLGDVNFYVPSKSYGHVEVIHQAVCHCLVDILSLR